VRIAITPIAVCVVLAAAGCTPSGESVSNQSTSSQVPSSATTTESTTASAPPITGFPDLSNYTEDTSGSYEVINSPRTQGFSFSTSNGLICGNNAYPDVEFEMVGCRGPMPHEGPGDWKVAARRNQQTTVENITGDPDYASAVKDPPPVLPPMHKLIAVSGDAVCAVDDRGMTACRVGDHGFVLTPTSTQLF
jgi:hypothetical protein